MKPAAPITCESLRRNIEIVTYCSNLGCRNSGIAQAKLEALGYTNVAKYAEGKQDWVEAGLPTESGPVAAHA